MSSNKSEIEETLTRDKNQDPAENQQKFFENQYQPKQFMRLFPGAEEPKEPSEDQEGDEDPEYNDDIEGIMQY